MHNDSYYVVQGWMVNELRLSGNNLIAYAIIYGFSHDGNGQYRGSLKELSEWMTTSKSTAQRALSELQEAGLINKIVDQINGVTFNRFTANRHPKKADEGGIVNLNRGYQNEGGCSQNEQGGIVNLNRGGIVNLTTHNNVFNKEVNNNPLTPLQGEGDDDESDLPDLFQKPKGVMSTPDTDLPIPKMMAMWSETHPDYTVVPKSDYPAARKIFALLAKKEPNLASPDELRLIWGRFLAAVASHPFYKDKPLRTVFNHVQDVLPYYFEIERSGRNDIVRIEKDKEKVTFVTKNGPVVNVDQPSNKDVKIRLKGWM